MRLPWLATVAIVAGSIADPLVETLSNAGVFGRGITDNDHGGVLPALVCGVLLAVVVACVRACRIWRTSNEAVRDRFGDLARSFARGSFRRDLPAVFAFQAVVLYTIENAEQLTLDGHLVTGFAWLGAPLIVSLVVHALIGTTTLVALGACMRAFTHAVAEIVCEALRTFRPARSRARVETARDRMPSSRPRHQETLLSRHTAGRAPPALLRTKA